MVWKYSWGNINNLHNLPQNIHPKIKFSVEYNIREITFLDILIKNQNNLIIADICHKTKHTHQYPPKLH